MAHKILVIDDNKSNLTTIEAILQNNLTNCTVLIAQSGKEGIKIAKKEQPDTILLEVIMPDMDGYETCKRLKENKSTKHIPVIMITAVDTNTESRIKGLNTGADAFLYKPIDPAELLAQVKVMLRINEAEKEWRKIENEYKLLFNQVADPIVIFDQKTKMIIDCNTAMINKYGYSFEELLEMTPLELHLPKEDFERVKINIDNKEDFSAKEYQHKGKDGTIFYVETHSSEVVYKGHDAWITIIRDINERKQVEDKLRESEEKFRSLFSTMTEGVYLHEIIYDQKGEAFDYRIIDTNPASEKHLNIKPEDAIGKLATELYETEGAPYLDIYAKVAKTGIHFQFEEYFPPLKKHFHISVYSTEIGKFATIFFDITDRKQKEIELIKAKETAEENKKLLNETGRIGKVGGWEFNIDTLKSTWTEETYLIHEVDFNYDPNVEKGINFYTSTSKPIIDNALGRAIKFGEPFNLELEIITAKNNLRNIHTIGKADLENRRVYGFFQDITERKQAEEELQDSKDYLDKIINTVASPLFVKNEKHEFSLVNDALCSLLNLRAEELIGKTGFEHFPEEQMKVFIAKDQEVLSSGIENINEEQLTDGTGKIRTIVTRKTLYTDPAGNKFLVGVINDITERKQAEEALTKKMDEMQRFHNLTVDRELIMIDLKKEVNELLKKSGLDEKYTIVG
ncbi:PAS domain S-box protein [Bacteroidota bacterium]